MWFRNNAQALEAGSHPRAISGMSAARVAVTERGESLGNPIFESTGRMTAKRADSSASEPELQALALNPVSASSFGYFSLLGTISLALGMMSLDFCSMVCQSLWGLSLDLSRF